MHSLGGGSWRRFLVRLFCRLSIALIAVPASGAEIEFQCKVSAPVHRIPCTVVLAPHHYELPLLTFDSDKYVEVPFGQYDLRAGAPGYALAANSVYTVDSEDAPLHGAILVLTDGGRVNISPSLVAPHGAVQLLSISSGRTDTLFLDRETSVPFPAGRFVAFASDSPEQLAGISDILEVRPNGFSTVSRIRKPKPGTGNLVLAASFSAENSRRGEDIESVALTPEKPQGRAIFPAALTARGPSTLYAVFFDVPAGAYSASLKSDRWQFDRSAVSVAADRVTLDSKHTLIPPSKLSLKFDVDPSLTGARREARLYSCPDYDPATTYTFWPDLKHCTQLADRSSAGDVIEFVNPPSGPLFALARVANRERGAGLNFVRGKDQEVSVVFHPLHLSGVVTSGSVPHQAILDFENEDNDQQVGTATSDSDGRYLFTFWAPGNYWARVGWPDSSPERRFPSLISVGEAPEQHQDFQLPDTAVEVRVSDRTTSAPVAGARVMIFGANFYTDASGSVLLPPVPHGNLRVGVSADGYATKVSEQFEVADTSSRQTFAVSLNPLAETLAFQVLLPSGLPATSARGFLGVSADPLNGLGQPFACDPDGNCQLPADASDADPVFLWDPAAAVTATTVGEATGLGQVTLWPTGGELRVAIEAGNDKSIVHAFGAITIGGVRIPNAVLRACRNQDIAVVVPGAMLDYRTLPPALVTVTVFAMDLPRAKPATFRQIAAPLLADTSAPVTLTCQLP